MSDADHRVTVYRENNDKEIRFLVIGFVGDADKRIEEDVRAEYGINGMHRRLEPYRVENGWEIIYVRQN